jgi:hypothetical protein
MGERLGLTALVDPGSYLNLLDAVLGKELGLKWQKLPPNVDAYAANGTSMTIYGVVEVELMISDTNGHKVTHVVPFLVADLKRFPIYLGMPWVSSANPIMDFKKKELFWRTEQEALETSFVSASRWARTFSRDRL